MSNFLTSQSISMKRILLLSAILCCTLSFAQKTQVSLGLNGVGIFPMGNNYLKDGVGNFAGAGFTFQTIFKTNMGFGVELGRSYTKVQDKSIYGELTNPRLTNISAYYVYKYPFANSFAVEGQLGLSLMALTSESLDSQENYTEHAAAFFFGGEFSYQFPNTKILEIYASPKLYFFDSLVKFDEKAIDRYFSRAPLLNINVGIRLNLNQK